MFKQISSNWIAAAALLTGLYFVTLNITGHSLTWFPGDLGDARFNIYILEHAHRFFTGDITSYWDAPFFYPEPSTISYSDNLLGSAPLYSAFRIAGFDRDSSFIFWTISLTILNFLCCYLFLKSTFKNSYAAAAGAFIFAFSIGLQSQMSHAQTFPRFPVPLAVWMALRFSEDLKSRHFFLALLSLTWQFYCGIYLGLMLSLPVAVILIYGLWTNRAVLRTRIIQVRWLTAMAGSIALNATLLVLLLLPYYQHSKLILPYKYADVLPSIPTVRSWFSSHPGSILWDPLSKVSFDYDAYYNHQIFPGGIALIFMIIFVVAGIAFLFRKLPAGWTAGHHAIFLAIVCTFFFFTRYNSWSFYSILFKVPGFNSMRSLARIINIDLLFFAYAAAFVTTKFFEMKKVRFAALAGSVLLVALSADNYVKWGRSYHIAKSYAECGIEVVRQRTCSLPRGTVISYEPYEIVGSPIDYQIDAMLAAQDLDLVSVNGYSATSPNYYYHYWNSMDRSGRMEWFNFMKVDSSKVVIIR